MLPPEARYFPVQSTPLRFQAGLMKFGTDFGNGAADRCFFQIDAQRDRYLAAKREVGTSRHTVLERNQAEARVHRHVLAWVNETLCREHPAYFDSPLDSYRAVGAAVQEDLVVMHRRPDGSDVAIAVDVCFPSDWRPERIADSDFRFIHGPVPGFADTDAPARAMVSAMIDRGPHLRFVWTLKPSDDLDLHPEEGRHPEWSATAAGVLRVERQVTVPFTDVAAALFLIRTYLYPFTALSAAQRATLRAAAEAMPPDAARYKGIAANRPRILALLA